MRRILTLPFLLLNLCVLGTSCWAADVFDKAEGIARNYKECANSGANCEASKWLNRAVQLDKCAKEGNCAQKAGQKIAEHQDSIEAAVHKLARINQCANMPLTNQEGTYKCYESAKESYRQRAEKNASRDFQKFMSDPSALRASSCYQVKKVAINLITLGATEVCSRPNDLDLMKVRDFVTEAYSKGMKATLFKCAHACARSDPLSRHCPDTMANEIATNALQSVRPDSTVCVYQ